jgi:hypothetical protein
MAVKLFARANLCHCVTTGVGSTGYRTKPDRESADPPLCHGAGMVGPMGLGLEPEGFVTEADPGGCTIQATATSLPEVYGGFRVWL